MKLTVFLLFISGFLFAQDSTNYRFSFGVSGISIMHYGIRDLKNVPGPSQFEYQKVYNTETYQLNYENFNFSKGVNFNFGVFVFNNDRHALKIRANLFYEKFNENMTYTLTGIGNGSEVNYGSYYTQYTSNNIKLGYSNQGTFISGFGVGSLLDIIYFKKIRNNFRLGAGCFLKYLGRPDSYSYLSGSKYIPIISDAYRGFPYYSTKKIGISVELQKKLGRFNLNFNLSQNILTLKKDINKGAIYFNEYGSKTPISQNLDFRFPLIIKLGAAIEFGKIKK
jgi:hypothetical protein